MSHTYKKGTFLLAVHVGSGGNTGGPQYTMQLVNGITPAVQSESTGKTFVLGWEDIIKLAVDAGVDVADA